MLPLVLGYATFVGAVPGWRKAVFTKAAVRAGDSVGKAS